MIERIFTVTEFNRLLKISIEENQFFKEIFIKGEISNITYYKSGHLYFSIKDRDAQIKCVAFNYKYKRISEDLKEGDAVKIFCDVGLYESRGEIQVLVRHVEKEQELGEMFQKLEMLKKDMEAAGYFSQDHKKKLPRYPENIGIVTALTGAALQDMIKTIRKRDNRINIYISPAKVQGIGSKDEIATGIEILNRVPEIDFIVAGRGGGSIEDLWSFNEKKVAVAFFNSKKPIISAVGHETDMLLSDLTADVRASTPTQAIEIAVPEKKELQKKIGDLEKRAARAVLLKLQSCEKELERFRSNYLLKNFHKEIERYSGDLVMRENEINHQMKNIFREKTHQLKLRIEKIIGLNPMKILENGYSITEFQGESIKNASQLSKGDEILVRFKTGAVKSIVKEIIECQ